MAKNTVSQKQFLGPAPRGATDYEDRVKKTEAAPPDKKRGSVQLGNMSQARPGLAGIGDFKSKRGK